jgi:hypothetical protein
MKISTWEPVAHDTSRRYKESVPGIYLFQKYRNIAGGGTSRKLSALRALCG